MVHIHKWLTVERGVVGILTQPVIDEDRMTRLDCSFDIVVLRALSAKTPVRVVEVYPRPII